jgi:hypothetical protein
MAGDKLKITCNSFPPTNNNNNNNSGGEMVPTKQSDYFLKAPASQSLDGKPRTAPRVLANGFNSMGGNRRMFGKAGGGAFSGDPGVEEGLQKVGQNLIDIIDSDGGSGGDGNSQENFQAQDDVEGEEDVMRYARNMGFYESRMNKHNNNHHNHHNSSSGSSSNDATFQTKQQAPGGPQRSSMPFSPSAPAQLPQPHGPSSTRAGPNSPRSVSTFSMTTLLSTSTSTSTSKSQVGSPVTAESIRAKRQEHAQALIQQHQIAAARVAANAQTGVGSPGAGGDAHHHAQQPARRSHEQARFSPLVQVLRDHMVSLLQPSMHSQVAVSTKSAAFDRVYFGQLFTTQGCGHCCACHNLYRTTLLARERMRHASPASTHPVIFEW